MPEYLDVAIPKGRQHIMYTQNPVKAMLQLNKLRTHVKKRLEQIKSPLLVIHSKGDDVAAPKSAQLLYNRAASKNKKLRWLGNEHTFLIDLDKDAYNRISYFLTH